MSPRRAIQMVAGRDEAPLRWAEGEQLRLLESLLKGETQHEILFQPIVDLRQGVVTGYEALSRFPSMPAMRAGAVLQVAERHKLRDELEHMLCSAALAERENLPENCFLTINAGPEYLLGPWWQRTLSEVDDLAGVVVEITEETAITSYGEVRRREDQIRAMGGLVAVDDAGAGYASLEHIIELRPDFIKLDRGFVHGCHADKTMLTMIEMIGAAAEKLDAWVIAEGVEAVEDLEELIRMDVPLAQGFLLGRPERQMQPLNETVAEQMGRRSRSHRQRSMEPHMSVCALCLTMEAAGAALRDMPHYRVAMVVDPWRRPMRMLEQNPLLGTRLLDVFMKVQVTSAPREVLRRAMARPAEKRFDSIAVIDHMGVCVGVVEVHRLVEMVLALDGQKG